jgi:hypothetical protein
VITNYTIEPIDEESAKIYKLYLVESSFDDVALAYESGAQEHELRTSTHAFPIPRR